MSSSHAAKQELARHTPRHDIQGLRAIAVLIVVLFHAGLGFHGGFVGVDVFFVISGFVITAMFMREHASTGSISLRTFYSRRIRRLMPALALVVAVVLTVTIFLGSPFNNQQEMTALTGAGAMLAVANIVLAFRGGAYFETPPTANPLLNTWSLSVEEQFYLVFPFVLLLAWVAFGRRGHRLLGNPALWISLLALGSFALSLGMSVGGWPNRLSDPEVFAFYFAPARAWEFAVGALVALAAPRLKVRPRVGEGLVGLGLAGILASALLITEAMPFPGWVALIPVLFTALAIVGGSSAQGPISALLSNRFVVAVGDRSYSWYLWHWPMIAFACILWPTSSWSAPLAAIASVPVAWLAFSAVENPLRFDRRLVGRRLLVLTAICLVTTLTLAGVVFAGARMLWWNDALRKMDAQVSQEHAWITLGCNTSTPLGQRPPECTLGDSTSDSTVYLVGDSQAGMLTEGVATAADSRDHSVSLGTMGACPFITATVIADGQPNDACTAFVERSITWLDSQPASTVVIGSWAAYMWLDGIGLQVGSSPPVFDQEQRMAAFEAGLMDTVGRLTRAGHHVVLLAPIPGFPEGRNDWTFWYPYRCNTVEALVSIDNCGAKLPVSVELEQLAPYSNVFTRVAERFGAQVLDLTTELCPDGICTTNRENEWAYLDGQHISVGESQRLAPLLAPYLRS